MKSTFVIAGLLSAVLLLGCTAVSAEAALPKTQEGLIKELIASIDRLTQLLSGVETEQDVTAAKAKMETIMGRQVQLGQAMKTMPKPEAAEEARLEKLYKKTMDESMGRLAAQYQRLAGVKGFKETVAAIKAKLQK